MFKVPPFDLGKFMKRGQIEMKKCRDWRFCAEVWSEAFRSLGQGTIPPLACEAWFIY